MNKEETPINVVIKEALEAEKRTNRWLIEEIKAYGVELNDTQMSNRLTGYIDFQFNEAIACMKVLKIPIPETSAQ